MLLQFLEAAKKQASEIIANARAEAAKIRDDSTQQLKTELDEKRTALMERLETEENERRAIMEAAKAGEVLRFVVYNLHSIVVVYLCRNISNCCVLHSIVVV